MAETITMNEIQHHLNHLLELYSSLSSKKSISLAIRSYGRGILGGGVL
jgi:hypothetical protein